MKQCGFCAGCFILITQYQIMFSRKKYIVLLVCLMSAGLFSCKKWDDHTAITEQALNENLLEQINKQTELSKFSEYLVKTGLDKEISSSKNYTVWAPTNTALATLAADVVSDTAKLKAFLLNHISAQLFFTRQAQDTVRVQMMNGKRVSAYRTKFDEATITKADVYVRNGVLQIIDKMVPPLMSVFEYMNSAPLYAQNKYLTDLTYNFQDPAKAELDSINPVTGNPVYKPGTGIVRVNAFRTKVYDVANEDSLYTYIVLSPAAYTTEIAKQLPYFKSVVPNLADSNAAWNVSKDLALKGVYTPTQLAAGVVSKFGVRVAVTASGIVATQKLSNGVLYIVNAVTTTLADKIPAVFVQGEAPYSIKSNETRYLTKLFFRQRATPAGVPFTDMYLNLGTSGANFWLDYITNDLYAGKYKVYIVALNDKTISGQGDDTYGTDSTLQQITQIFPNDSTGSATFVPAFRVQTGIKPYTYTETFIGDYTNNSYDAGIFRPASLTGASARISRGTTRIRLLTPLTLTGIPYNLTCDYIKFVPQF